MDMSCNVLQPFRKVNFVPPYETRVYLKSNLFCATKPCHVGTNGRKKSWRISLLYFVSYQFYQTK